MLITNKYSFFTSYETQLRCYENEDENETKDAEGFKKRQAGGTETGDSDERAEFAGGGDAGHGETEYRHYAGYPVTRHETAEGGEGCKRRREICVCTA